MVFQFAQGGEDLFFAVQVLAGEFGGAGGYLKIGGAQEGVDLPLVGEGHGQGGGVRGGGQAAGDVGIVRLDVRGEAQVGGGVFVGGVEQGVFR